MPQPRGLGPHLVGRRVVVRRLLRGGTGPSGGPAFTDLLGVMESWAGGVTTVRGDTGEAVEIPLTDIVSGKAVPPRPSPRMRVSPEEAERRANASWPALVTQPLGEWLLRASGGFSSRANSAMAVGDPGVGFSVAVDRLLRFYVEHRLPPWAQVVVGSEVHRRFDEAGWVAARPGEADTEFQLASVARALRTVRSGLPPSHPQARVTSTCSSAWLAGDPRAREYGDTALAVLEGPEQVGFATVRMDPTGGEGHPVAAKGRVACARGDDWVGITDVWVSPHHRRRGLAGVVLGALLEWAAERGATTAYLQVRGDNPAALALYGRLGFATHHTYRYLAPAPGG